MELADILPFDCVLPSLKASGKKQVLQEIGHRASEAYGLDCGQVIENLLARERLGSTAMGSGVAIPHARMDGVERIVGVFARLEKPVEFESADDQGVDLVFALLAPEQAGADHLRALAKVSRVMRDEDMRQKLRGTSNAEALHSLLMDVAASRAA